MEKDGAAFLLVAFTLLLYPCPSSCRFLRFEPGYEYQYKFQSDAQVHNVDKFTMEARIGYTCLGEVEEGQEMKLNVIALNMQAGTAPGQQGHNWDFSKWFSFVLTPHGEVTHVQHAANEDPETLAIKKGLAALLAARLHDHRDQDEVTIIKTDEGWRYHVQELGHEGPHNATYDVKPSEMGKVFTKTRHNHPVPHATGAYVKTVHYHEDMKIIHTVEISEHFDAMSEPPEGYNPYIVGHQRPDEDDEEVPPVLPSMTGEGRGKLEFLTRLRVADQSKLRRPDTWLTKGSIHIDEVKRQEPRINLTAAMDSISGNLTCMREQPKKGSQKLTDCFFALLEVLRRLSNDDITILADDYFGSQSSVQHFQRDREAMLDALWSVHTGHAHITIAQRVLLAQPPEQEYVERLLYHIGGADILPPEPVVQIMISLAFEPEKHAEVFQQGGLHHHVLLTVGALIRLMSDKGDSERASELGTRLQNMLGIHDPWAYRQRRSIQTEAEAVEEDLMKVVLLEALGNARLDQSYEHIVSHVNNSNSQWVKRAGVHALRDYHHDHAANVILMAALQDEHVTVRYEAALQYRRHPNAQAVPYDLVARARNTSYYTDPNTMDLMSLEAHHRLKRQVPGLPKDLFDPIELFIQSPSVDWQKQLGSDKIGASFGLTIKNELDLKIDLLSGHGKIDIHDEAFGQVNLGFMDMNVDILRARLCFRGHAEYNLNLFQEFDVDEIKRMTQMFDQLKKQTVDAVVDGIKTFKELLNGDTPFADIIKNFADAIKKLPDKIVAAGRKAVEALIKIGEYDDKELPPFIIPLKNLVMKVSNLINDIRSDVMGFYNKLMTATVVIPYGGKQIFKSVKEIIDSFKDFNKDPKAAVSTVTGNTLAVGIQIKAMVDAVKDAKEAAFFLKKEKPYWWDMRAQARELLNMSKEVKKAMQEQGPAWVREQVEEIKDDIKQFTNGKLSVAELKQQVIDELLALPAIVESILPLENLGDEIGQAFMDLFELVEQVKKAYDQLREGTRKAKQFIERVFGPKAHKRFPRRTRTPGGGCDGKGFYPATLESGSNPEYQYEGVDLLLDDGYNVVAPFPGIIYLSGNPNEVVIESRGGSPRGVDFVITNIKPNSTVRLRSDRLYNELEVAAGQVIGVATKSPCKGFNHIHFSIRKGNKTLDPTRYVEPRLPEMPQWIQECDDYKFVYKGRTLRSGSIVGLANRNEEDTSPERTPEVDKPAPIPTSKDPSTKLDADANAPNSVAKRVQDNKEEAKKTAGQSKDNALKTLFQSAATFLKKFNLKDMKMGALVKLLSALQFDDSMTKLTNVFQTIQAMLDNKPCLNPNQMSDDDLATELRKQGKSTVGSREQLINRYTARTDKCMTLSLGLPKQMYCTMDQQCLGLECCLDIKVAFFRKVYKLYARFDPCSFNFIVGISGTYEKTFGPDYGLDDIFGGFEEEVPTGITISQLSAELFIHVALIKEETSVTVSVTAKFCKQDDSEDCLAVLPVLDRALLPVPSCGPDGTLYFPSMAELKESLKSQKDKFIQSGKELGKEVLRNLADEVFNLIPCLDSDDASDEPPCERPDKMTEETLTQTLESRGLDTSGTLAEKIARLELADRTCKVPVIGKTLTLPPLNDKLSRFVYITLDEKCLGINACVDIPIPKIDYHRSVRASVSLDACMPTFRAQFESCSYEILLFNTSIDAKYDFPLSDFFGLKTNIKKLDADTSYTVDLGMRIQLEGSPDPIVDDFFVEGFEVPIPICSDFVLPGNGSLRELAAAAGDTLSTGAVRFFMKTLKLDTIFIEGTCEEVDLQPPDCPWEINFTRFIPDSFKDHLTCVMTPNCLGIQCCIDLSVKLPLMKQPIDYYVPFHLMFLPCENMKIDMLFGTYTREEQLLHYEFGAPKKLPIGKGQHDGEEAPVILTYAVDHYRTMDPYDEGFLLDLNLQICIPFDGERICFPDDSGIDVLKEEKVPVCNPETLAELRQTNLTAFLEEVRQLDAKSLTRSAAQVLLNKFGITHNLKENRCDPKRAPYDTAVDGWNNECTLPIQKLPSLPESAVCHFSPACNRLDCCLYSEFLDMTFNVWFELNCDLYIQAGLERLASPKLYVLGGEIDWDTGISGEVNISEAFKLEYLIRKDDMNFILDVTAKLCFDGLGGTCQFSLNVMEGTRVPQLGCHPGAVSYFTDLQFFERQTCRLPPAATGCPLSLPASLNGKCVLTDECLGIQCCVPVNLGLLGTYAMDTSFKFDPCIDSFVYSLEQKTATLSLSSIVDVPQTEDVGKAISFTYRVHKTINGYTLKAEVRLCALDPDTQDITTCFDYDILPDVITIYAPSSDCTRRRRRRKRQAEKIPCSQSTLPRNELILHMIENEATLEEIEECMADFQRAEESKCDELDGAQGSDVNMFTPKAIAANMGGANPGTLIYCNKKSLLTVDVEGAEIIQGMLKKVEDIKGRLEQTFVPGKGLTGAGAKALGLKVANMTMGELQAFVMSEGVDPELAIQLMKDMKDLLYTLYSDIMASITDSGADDLFKSFDLSLAGDFSIPRTEAIFFSYSQFFMVGGLLPMTFKFEAGISHGTVFLVGAKMMSMLATGEVQPYVGLVVRGELGIGALLYGKLRLTGYICQIAIPSKAEITFSSFPLALNLGMNMDLKPLELKLTALVTLEINLLFETIVKTLFKTNLWHYETPSIRKPILAIGKAEQDMSPPSFASFEDEEVGRKRRAQATNQCTVRQLDGRDHTEPAIEIGVAASDDKSKPTLVAYIGTQPGLQDLLVTELGGPSTIINEHLGVSGQPVYFKVVATNNEGSSSEVSCAISTYDITPPTGRLEAEFRTSSNRRALHGALVVYEDSEITVANLALGTGKGVYGAGVRLWEPVGLKDRTAQAYNAGGDLYGDIALNDHFTDFKEGRLVVPEHLMTQTTTAQTAGECAKKCLSYTENKCMSFNFDTTGDCELMAAIESHDHKLAVATNYLHYERLGIGLAHSFKFNVQDLVHNTLYFFNLYMENGLGYTHYISSQGTLFDLTPPEPGPMVIASDTMENVPCEANLPSDRRDDWIKWCRGMDPTVHNHRIVIDAPGSATVFNGHTRLFDLRYTKANTYISANWDGIHDYESGILGYSLAVGQSVCEEIHVHRDPHKHLVPIDDDSQWTHIGVINMEEGYNLPDGKYYVTVRVLNEVEYGGPLATSFCHSTPLSIDTTPPEIYEVFGTRYDEDTFNITAQYNASDPHSDIATADICLGLTVLTCDEMSWGRADQLGNDTSQGPVSVLEQIRDGVPVWVRIRVQNNVDLQAVGHANSPIIVDTTPPVAGTVYDGPISRHDLNFSKDQYQYCANWYNFTDAQSGIDYYMGAVLSSTGDMMTSLTLLDRRQHVTCMQFSDQPLQHNMKYHFLLYAFNGGHKQLNVSAESDGVLVDLTAPEAGDVVDGLDPGFKDVSFTVHKATVAAQWRDFRDPESGITQYEVRVKRAANLTSNFEVIQDWTNEELVESFEAHNFHLHHRDVVKTEVRATNGALNTITEETNAYIVDLTPPVRISLWDGSGSTDREYQSEVTRLEASFVFEDEESGVNHYKYQVYQTQYGHRTQILPASRNSWVDLASGQRTDIEVTGLTLTPGLRYSLRVAAVNNAGAVAAYDTDGVIVDNTPPTMEAVSVGVLSSEDEVAIDGYVLQSDRAGIKATWLATDHESGISHYEVAVGTTSGGTDVLMWRNMGKEQDGYIDGLTLELNSTSGSPEYYVTVRATNGAGILSSPRSSTPIKVLEEDQAGVVMDGGVDTTVMSAVGLRDVDEQSDQWAVTAQFRGFTSHLHGLTHFDWSVGTSPDAEDVMPLTAVGIVHDEEESGVPGMGVSSRGVAQAVLPLEPGKTYYTTVRAMNNDGQAVQSTSDGFTLDTKPPQIGFISVLSETDFSRLAPETVLYQQEPDALSAQWNYSDTDSKVVSVRYAIGTYPGDATVVTLTPAEVSDSQEGTMPSDKIDLRTDGSPNLLSLWAEDAVGLSARVVSPSVVVDISGPEEGTVICPSYIQAHSQVVCRWSGFQDLQSPLRTFTFFMGTAAGKTDVLQPVTLGPGVSSYVVTGLSDVLSHDTEVFATVVATNAVGLNTSATSGSISMDTTPPVAGTVVELSDAYTIVSGNATATELANIYTCDSLDDCQALDVVCQESLTTVLVAWSAFEDPETGIAKYEVAVGTSAGGGQIKAFHEVPAGQRYHLVEGLDLMGERQIFVTVKATNGAGASTSATSNGVYLSYLSQGLTPPGPVEVWDQDSEQGDIDYHTSLTTISSRWIVEGDPCPATRYEWAIERVDGLRVQDYYDTQGKAFGLNDGLALMDLETYYQLVRVTNAIGYTYTLRSDGVTIHQNPLIPGQIFDGSKTGFDLNFQPSQTKVSANWQGFGEEAVVSQVTPTADQSVETSAIKKEKDPFQEVAFYEVALGTDRRYDSTRDNVVPWTNVGLNTSVTFYDLSLTPLEAIYYFSVRAHSASNSRAEVTSNGFSVGFDGGVSGGTIDMEDYVNSDTALELTWDGFESDVGMFFYYVAVSSAPVDNSSCQAYTEGGSMGDTLRRMQFDIADRSNTGDQTFAFLTGLNMTQNTDNYVHVIGVDRAGQCRMISKMFHVDITPPVAGKVRTGPYYDMAMTFAPSASDVTIVWKDFSDPDSPLDYYRLELLMQPACDISAPPGGDVIASVEIEAVYTEYTFLEQQLVADLPYFVRVTAVNKAGLSVSVTSPPTLYDNSAPVGGLVVDGTDFRSDLAWSGSSALATATILHLPTPNGPACPSRPVLFSDTQWTFLASAERQDLSGRVLDITSQPAKAKVGDSGQSVTITLTRDTNMGKMYSAAMFYEADLVKGGTYEVDIQAADGSGHAVTSIMLWDGPDTGLVQYDYTPTVEQDSFCLCCLENPRPANCDAVCDCTSYIADVEGMRNASDLNVRRKRSVEVKQLSSEDKEMLEAGGSLEDLPTDTERYPSCGLQLYTLNASDADYAKGYRGRMVEWCTFGVGVTYDPESVTTLLTFDPSADFHHYKLVVYEVADEQARPTKCFGVYVDDDTIVRSTVCGIPSLSTDTKIALTVWNWKNFLTNPNESTAVALWQTSATFKNLIIPAPRESLCRYGNPFRGGHNAIVRYEAGISSQDGMADLVPFREVYTPCVPCVDQCDQYSCDPDCSTNLTTPLTLTLDGLGLEAGNSSTTVVYYFTVKAVLGSGTSVTVKSDGFSVDTTPPVFDSSVFFYLDAAQGEAKPVQKLMGSHSTIQVLYGCSDNESSVVEYEWAIGTTPGGQEIQNWTSTGVNPTGVNSSLEGIITHLGHYYVSVRCTNGGGLSTTFTDTTGVIAYIESLNVNDVSGDLPGTEVIDPVAIPPTARKSSDANSVSVSLQLSQDPTIDTYYFSISSTKPTANNKQCGDIFPRTVVASTVSGTISIKNGSVYKNDAFMFSLRASRQGYNGSDSTAASAADFQMEPGRELFAFVDSCNEAQCTGCQLIGSVVVVAPQSFQAVSQTGAALDVNVGSGPVTRTKRSASQVFVQTPAGLLVGQSIVLTELTHTELTTTYDSAASTSFVSYISNPEDTLYSVETVDRILAGRATYSSTVSIAFALTSVGQVEMPGPLTVTYPYDPTDTEETVTLLHWNPVLQKWQQSHDTCTSETDTFVKDPTSSTITVKVCDTYGSNNYFVEQTLFLLSAVNNTIPNSEPYLTSATSFTMAEDQGTALYQIAVDDTEGDTVMIQLAASPLTPDEGELILAPGNLLMFTPCADCSGEYLLKILLTEDPVPGIPPATATATITATVTAVNDAPVAFAFHNGTDLVPSDPTAEIEILLEQNHINSSESVPYTFVVGAYDVDASDTLTLTVDGADSGTLTLGVDSTAAPDCSPSADVQDDTIPCSNMTLPHDANSLSWRYLSLTYQPDVGFSGYDTVQFLARDNSGSGSFLLTVKFAVMEQPCQNGGTCQAKDSSYTCHDSRRAQSFDTYYICNCTAGFFGLHCDDDFDECYSSPCSWPLVCYDGADSYRCACPADDPDCEGLEGWMIALIVLACTLVVLTVLLGLYIWAVRTGRIKWSLLKNKKRPGSRESRGSTSSVPPTPPADYQFTNQAFEDVDYNSPMKGETPLFVRTMTPNLPPVLHAVYKQERRPSMDTGRSTPNSKSSSLGSVSLDSQHDYNPDHIYRPVAQEQTGMSGRNVPRPDSHLLGALLYDPMQASHSAPSSPIAQRRSGRGSIAEVGDAWNKKRQFLMPDYLSPMSSTLTDNMRSVSEVQVFMHGKRNAAKLRRSSDTVSIGSTHSVNRPGSGQSRSRPLTPVERANNDSW